jgi:hypothetical protein
MKDSAPRVSFDHDPYVNFSTVRTTITVMSAAMTANSMAVEPDLSVSKREDIRTELSWSDCARFVPDMV